MLFVVLALPIYGDEPIVVGMSAPFQGPNQRIGIELYRGAATYFAATNAKGGIAGRPIDLVAYNDGGDPEATIRNTVSLVEFHNARHLINYVDANTINRVLPMIRMYNELQGYDIELSCPFTGALPVRIKPYKKYVSHVRPSFRTEATSFVHPLATEAGLRRFAIIYEQDADGISCWQASKTALKVEGLHLTKAIAYRQDPTHNHSFDREVELLRACAAEAVIIGGRYFEAVRIIRTIRDAGWTVPIISMSLAGVDPVVELLTQTDDRSCRYTDGIIFCSPVPSVDDTAHPLVFEYRQAVQRHGVLLPPNTEVTPDTHSYPYSFVALEGYKNAKQFVKEQSEKNTPSRSVGSFDRERATVLLYEYKNNKYQPIQNWGNWKP